jgi:glycosyltransferase involved in cell wall biosynthesis
MSRCPTVSICLPTYNGREHLGECITSIRAQTFADFEVVLCDDESSDGTLDLAQTLAGGDPRFRFIANPRRLGLVGNWNNCVNQARGEWIKFVFQDDVISPTCLEKILKACQASGKSFGFCERDFIFEAGVSQSQRDWFDGHRQKLRLDYAGKTVLSAEDIACLAVKSPVQNLVGEPTVTLIHQSVFRELGGFDAALIQLCDAEFWCRAMINGGAVFVPESLAAFRIHAKATTALNIGKRVFRMAVLDLLVLQYRFAFGKHFGPVRRPQRTGKSILSQRRECAMAAAQAFRQAQTSADGSLLAEWQAVCAYCPGLQTLAHLGKAAGWLGRIKRGMFRLIGA